MQPKQLLFQRQSEHERLFVAVNMADEPYVFHFDAGCGRATDVIDGSDHDFGGGSEVGPFSAHFWLCERQRPSPAFRLTTRSAVHGKDNGEKNVGTCSRGVPTSRRHVAEPAPEMPDGHVI